MKDFYQRNALIRGQVEIGGRRVDLKGVTMPVLNIFASEDHLVPPDSSRALKRYVGTDDYTDLEFPGGHIGLYVSSRSQKMIPPAICKWLEERS
jgi:polyhydroxyalkanoate synthase